MKYIIALLILIPSVTFASWWNPTTWFQKEEVKEIVSEQIAPIQAVEPEVIEVIKPEVRVEKIIEYRTVTDNSSVASLQSQIVSLNQQIQILTNEKNSMYYHLNDCRNGAEEKDEWVSQIEHNYSRIAEIEAELNNYKLEHNMLYVPLEVETPLKNEQAMLYAEIDSLNLKLQVY